MHAWTVHLLVQLDREDWIFKRRRVVASIVLLAFLVVLETPTIVTLLGVLLLILVIGPYNWLARLKGKSAWLGLIFFFYAGFPALLYFIHPGLEIEMMSGELNELNVGISNPSSDNLFFGSNTMLGVLSYLLGFYYLFLPIRVIVAGLQGAFGLRIPIWLKLGFTYMFSALLPGLILVALLVVAAFTGIGTERASTVRNLIHDDLELIEKELRFNRPGNFAPRDSIAVGYYRRAREPGMPPASMPSMTQTGAGSLRRQVETPFATDPSAGYLPWQTGFDLGMRPSATRDASGREWVLEQPVNEPWTLPDTLDPFPGWTTSSRAVHGILTIKKDLTALAVILPDSTTENRLMVGLRPMNESLLKRYKRIVGCDISVRPSTRSEMEGDEHAGESGGTSITLSDRSFRFLGNPFFQVVETESSEETDDSFWEVPIYHGVSELMRWPGDEGGNQELLGFIVVRTSLKDLASSLYNTEGLNIIVVALLVLLGVLLFMAIVFSNILGFGIISTITGAVAQLRIGTERLRKGDLSTRLHISNRDELGELAVSFNRMTADLQRMVNQITEKERLERDVQIARTIQLRLLPERLPDTPGIDVAALSEPAQEVGGDYYDARELEDGRIMIAVGDVSGKGVAAAILMSNLQATLHVLVRQDLPLPEVVSRLNREIYRNTTPEMFITFFVGLFQPGERSLEYVNAGHDAPLLIRRNRVTPLEKGGLILGIMPDVAYETDRVVLQPNDLFAAYSDGVTEVMNTSEEEFGLKRLEDVIKSLQHAPCRSIVDGIHTMTEKFAGEEAEQQDDFTLLVLKVLPEG
ncbi:SpoIIE family protein phosphatase [bacterium]|nr:SpoIIE family protein phosphatase [bacterium]